MANVELNPQHRLQILGSQWCGPSPTKPGAVNSARRDRSCSSR
jgi:hypothetical protein